MADQPDREGSNTDRSVKALEAALAADDVNAVIEVLWNECRDGLVARGLRAGLPEASAHECVSQAFALFLERWPPPHFRNLPGLLWKITWSQIRTERQKIARRRLTNDVRLEEVPGTSDPTANLTRQQVAHELQAALAKLKPLERLLIEEEDERSMTEPEHRVPEPGVRFEPQQCLATAAQMPRPKGVCRGPTTARSRPMTKAHQRMEDSGLLGGRLDPASRDAWPAWAQQHVDRCRECGEVLRADALLRLTRTPTPPVPTERELRHLLERRVPADPGLFFEQDKARHSARRYRSSAGAALDLHRTPTGVTALDPDATDLLVFSVTQGRRPLLLARRRDADHALRVDATLEVKEPVVVVALAADDELDPDTWQGWLADVFRTSAPTELPLGSAMGRVRSQVLHLRPRPAGSMLRLVPGLMPEPDPSVTELTKQARKAAEAGHMDEACNLYRKGQERALALADVAGEVRAGIGLAQALAGLGYDSDADRVVDDLASRLSFDTKRANTLCNFMGWQALFRGDTALAERWLSEGAGTGEPDTGWRRALHTAIAFGRRDFASALNLLEEALAGVAAVAGLEDLERRERVVALAGVGRMSDARHAYDEILRTDDSTLETCVWRLLARRALSGRTSALELDVVELSSFLRRHPHARLSAWEVPPFYELVERHRDLGSPSTAALLLRLRFLPPDAALDTDVAALVAMANEREVLVTDPADATVLRTVPLPRTDVQRLIELARDEAVCGRPLSASQVLRALILGEVGFNCATEIVVASDGVLAGLPLQLLVDQRGGRRPRMPVASAITSPFGKSWAPQSAVIASLADALGDLPSAGREVTAKEATVLFRGREVTRQALASLPEVGLLHLGVHARREQGLPLLELADGFLNPVEISQLPMRGSPVVLLSGCATGAGRAESGIERSLVDGFLRAGSSAVIATNWPVEDREMYELVRMLIARWPFRSAAEAVAEVSEEACRRGLPARLWAAFVAYQPAEVADTASS